MTKIKQMTKAEIKALAEQAVAQCWDDKHRAAAALKLVSAGRDLHPKDVDALEAAVQKAAARADRPQVEPKPKAKAEIEPKAKAEPKPEPKPKAKAKAKAEPKPEAEAPETQPEAEPKEPSLRRVANALRTLSSEERVAMFTERFGRRPPPTATVTAVCQALALVLSVHGLPEGVLSKLKAAPKAGSKRKGGGRKFGWMSLMREMASRPEGVSMPELMAEGAARSVAATAVSGDAAKLAAQLFQNLKRHGFPLVEKDGRIFRA